MSTLEQYRQPWESDEHWELRKEFLERYADEFDEDRLLCLAQVYTNMELLNCSYPDQVERQVRELAVNLSLSKELRDARKERNTLHFVKEGGSESYTIDKRSTKSSFPKQAFVRSTAPSPAVSNVQNEHQEIQQTHVSEENFSDSVMDISETKQDQDDFIDSNQPSDDQCIEVSSVSVEITKPTVQNTENQNVTVDAELEAVFQKLNKYMKTQTFIGSKNPSKFFSATMKKFHLSAKYHYSVSTVESYSGSKEMHSCAIKLRDILISEDVSDDKGEACLRATEKGYRTLTKPIVYIDKNEAGVLCLKGRDVAPGTSSKPSAVNKRKKKEQVASLGSPVAKMHVANVPSKETVILNISNEKTVENSLVDEEKTKDLPVDKTAIMNASVCPDSNVRYLINENKLPLPPEFVIYDNTAIIKNDHPGTIILGSALFSKVPCEFEFVGGNWDSSGNPIKCQILLNKEMVIEAVGRSKEEAKRCASVHLLNLLKKKFYTIKVNNPLSQEDSFMITRAHLMGDVEKNSLFLSNDNVGHRMLKSMGWSGGGIGRNGNTGIVEPVKANTSHRKGQGLGFFKEQKTKSGFMAQIETILKDYVSSDVSYDIVFSTEFTSEERKKIHSHANRYSLKSISKGHNSDRQLIISKKYSHTELFRLLSRSGGKMSKYELIPPSQRVWSTS